MSGFSQTGLLIPVDPVDGLHELVIRL